MALNLANKFVKPQTQDDVREVWKQATGTDMPEVIEITLQHTINEQSGGFAYYSGRANQTDAQLLTSLAKCPLGAIVWEADTASLKNAGLSDEQIANPTAAIMEGMGGRWVYISGDQLLGSGFGVLINDGTEELADALDSIREKEGYKSLMVTYKVNPVLSMVNLTVKGRPTTSVTINVNSEGQIGEITPAKSGIVNTKSIDDLLAEARATAVINRQAGVAMRSQSTSAAREQLTAALQQQTLGKRGVTTATVAAEASKPEQAVTV